MVSFKKGSIGTIGSSRKFKDLNENSATNTGPDFLENVKDGNTITNTSGINKTDGTSLVGISIDGEKSKPGFTPNNAYSVKDSGLAPNAWYGDLLKSHIDSKDSKLRSLDISKRFDSQSSHSSGDPYSKRDTLLRFNDSSTDYLSHNLQIEGKTPFQSGKNERETFTGEGSLSRLRLKNFTNSSYENNDPVIYGFEIIIDAISSPLLNGAVEDFITQFSSISEVGSRANVIYDFKNQFIKLFKTKGNVRINPNTIPNIPTMSILNDPKSMQTIVNSEGSSDIFRPGRKAYLSYYLQKIDGLSNLIEKNTSEKSSYLNDYGKDLIKLSFLEDVSGTLSTLAHLYKLLYWSKPNGKGVIPENLLRFNCDIIVSECRNFNRVRKSLNSPDNLEIIKDNVSRHIYSLKECQFWFDKMPHEDSIDMGNIKTFDTYEISFDYKYSTSKYEKWTADPQKFGQYVSYNNGAIWKIGNKGARDARSTEADSTTGTSIPDYSVPKFFTVGTNTLKHNGVTTAIILEEYKISNEDDKSTIEETQIDSNVTVNDNTNNSKKTGDELGEDEQNIGSKKEKRKQSIKNSLDSFKENSKKTAKNALKKTANFVIGEVNNQIKIRAKLLEDTIVKIKNSLGQGGLSTDPKNVYPKPYTPHSFGIFFDVRNELFNFIGEDVATILQSGSNIINPTRNPMTQKSRPLSSIVQRGTGVVKNNSNYTSQTLQSILKRFGKNS
jgi:hypothetical protein